MIEFETRAFLSAAAAIVLCSWSMGVIPADDPQQNGPSNDELEIEKTINALGQQMVNIKPSPVEDVFEVRLESGPILYFASGGEYLFAGELMRVIDGKTHNLTQIRRNVERKALLEEVDPDTSLKFSPSGDVEHVVYVFTDVDDVYSQRFHRNLASYMAEGIEIRYLAFPKDGFQSAAYEKMVSVWCSKDPKATMSKSMRGDRIKLLDCSNPVATHYNLGREMYVTRVPSIVIETGRLIPLYMTAEQLKNTIVQDIQASKEQEALGLL